MYICRQLLKHIPVNVSYVCRWSFLDFVGRCFINVKTVVLYKCMQMFYLCVGKCSMHV